MSKPELPVEEKDRRGRVRAGPAASSTGRSVSQAGSRGKGGRDGQEEKPSGTPKGSLGSERAAEVVARESPVDAERLLEESSLVLMDLRIDDVDVAGGDSAREDGEVVEDAAEERPREGDAGGETEVLPEPVETPGANPKATPTSKPGKKPVEKPVEKPVARPAVEPAQKKKTPKKSATKTGAKSGTEGRDGGDGDVEMEEVVSEVVLPTRRDGRVDRAGKAKTLAAIATASREDMCRESQVVKKRVREITDEELEETGDTYDICDVKSMVGRCAEKVGQKTKYSYWVEWMDGSKSLVPRKDCKGAPDWLVLIDAWYDHREDCAEKGIEYKSLQRFLSTRRLYLMLGGSTAFDCVFTAVQAAVQLVTPAYFDKLQAAQAMYKKSVAYDRIKSRGLTKQDTNEYFDFLTSKKGGWKVEIGKSQYAGMYTGFLGVANCATEPGVYIVAVTDKARQGHWFAMWVTGEKKDLEYITYEAAMPTGLADEKFQEVLFVRKVVKSSNPRVLPVGAKEAGTPVAYKRCNVAVKSKSRVAKKTKTD